jgi:SAM-dependent methyltransferase
VAARGFEIHCIDPGQKLVAIARRACRAWPRVTFEVGRFEDAAIDPGTYDLVFSAQAFHWIDPAVRWKKSHEVLAPGGSLALLYNYSPLPETSRERDLMELVQTLSKGAMKPSVHEDVIRSWVAEAESTGLFRDVSVHRHRWTQRYETERYIGLFGTYPDFRQLDAETQSAVADGMRRFLRDHDGHTDRLYESVLIHAKRITAA